jgi:GDP-D-mannose dehydratase
MKTALTIVFKSQDGSYPAEILLSKRYRVVGISRWAPAESFARIRNITRSIEIASGYLLG